jgi:hypothetical protein
MRHKSGDDANYAKDAAAIMQPLRCPATAGGNVDKGGDHQHHVHRMQLR